MRIDILSVFPDMFTGPLTESMLKRAQEKKIVTINIHDLRSFTNDKHHSVDDRPFGGGPGMVFKPEPIYAGLRSLGAAKSVVKARWPAPHKPLVIYFSPQGMPLEHALIQRYLPYKHLILLCGHYEGIDERAMRWVHHEVSIGDYVLTGGELPAMVFIDSLARFLPGVVKEKDSVEQDSFTRGLLDHPHYTRPKEFRKIPVPEVLLSGDHAQVAAWRKEKAIEMTLRKRPDLLQNNTFTKEEKNIIKKIKRSVKGETHVDGQ